MKSSRTPSGAQNVDELIANISQLMAEAEEMLGESPSMPFSDRARRNAGRFIVKYDVAKAKLAAVARSTDTAIRRYPYESVTIALGLGIGIGALFVRSRR
jgi:ElaB/YqjD/DUF883 family membrane-anchored ribosome-binding protein